MKPQLVVGVALLVAAGVSVRAQEVGRPEKPPASVSQLEAAIEGDPDNPALYVALGLAHWDQKNPSQALEAFRRAVEAGPRSVEAHNWLGVALAERADFPGAIAALENAIKLDPTYGRAYTNLGSVLAKSGDLAGAVAVFQKALGVEPNDAAAHLNLGMALRESGDLDAALEHLRRVASANPADARMHYELGQTLRQRGDLTAAVAAFEKALEIEPELREGYYALGVALKQQAASLRKPPASSETSPADALYTRAQDALTRGDLKVAREQLTEALRLDERHAESHNVLGFILGQGGDLHAALVHLERAVALQPESSAAHYNLGVALWYSGSKEKALSELQRSVSLDPASGASHAFLGTALRDKGDVAGARTSLQHAIALLPPTAAIYIDLGITYLRGGELGKALGQIEAGLNLASPAPPTPDWDGAVASLRQALSASADRTAPAPDAERQARLRAEAHHLLGLLLGRKGADSSEVAAEFRAAIRLYPDFAEAHNHLGLVLLQAGKEDEAVATLREAVRIRPDYADAHDNLGAALTPTNATEAIDELEKAVALAPDSVKARFNLAIAYGTSPDLGAAKEIEQLRKVVGLAPGFARAHLALGRALLQDGKVAEAVAELQETARLEPTNGEAHYQLGLALARAGRAEEASVELRKGRELVAADDRRQNAALDIADGRAALEKGELADAAAKLRHALQLQPESAEARRYLDVVLKKQGEADAVGTDDSSRIAELEEYVRQGKFKEVEPLLSAYVTQRPTSSWGWYALGYSRFAQQKIGEAITALAKSLELDIRNADAHKILGRSLMIIGRFDAARVEFEQGIRYKPDAAEIHYNLGKLFSIEDNWEPARQAFEAALRIDPSYVEALDALGFAQEALGDDTGAVASYEKAIALNEARGGSFASAHVNLSAFYNRNGSPGKALEHARKALEMDTNSDRAWFQKGRADEREGRMEEAVDAVNHAIALNARASSYYYVLAGLYRRLGKMEESRKALESFTRLEREAGELEKKRRDGSRSNPGAARE